MNMAGTVVPELVDSRVLRGNPLGDPHVRRVPIYLPPSYGRGGRRYPVIYLLAGFTGSGEMLQNRLPWSETFAERCDRLIARRRMVESIVVMPDCFTRYGGSQYLNSSATGRYEDHLVKELVAHVDRSYRTIPGPGTRAVMGKSSGGYGAIVQGMRHPETFGVVCCTSGDMYFLYCYLPDFPKAADAFRKHGGSCASFLRAWERMPKRMDMSLFPAINTLAMASCYSPNPKSKLGFDLPIDEKTGELRDEVWRRWLAWDPVMMVRRYARNLKKLSLLFLDCGTRDEFQLHHGMRIFHRKAKALGIAHAVEEFDDGHMNIPYRFDRSLEMASRAFRRAR
jgi:enterochelin esterase family protein